MKILKLLLVALTTTFIVNSDLPAQSYTAILTGRGEVPPVVTSAYGEVIAELNGDTLIISGSFRNLNGEFAANIAGGAHIHAAYAGRTGSIAHPLTTRLDSTLRNGIFEADSNRIVLTPADKDALEERALYINIHSAYVPSGEIRGQIIPTSDAYFVSALNGSYENPAVPSRGRGALVLNRIEDTLTVSGTFNSLSSPLNIAAAGGMHLHIGAAGQNGPIEIPLVVTADTTGLNGVVMAMDNRFVLSSVQKQALTDRRFYVNVHSMNFGGGELRGQVTGNSVALFRAHLSGMHELPFVPTLAAGMVICEIGADSTIAVSGSFAGIRSGVATDIAGGAHIHLGVAGRNGGIQFPLNSDLNFDSTGGTFMVDSNVFKLNSGQYDALLHRNLYVNIHSRKVRSGELRGQILPESQMVFNANISSIGTVPSVKSPAGGLVKCELNGNQLTLTGSLTGLTTEVDTNIAGGAHIHMARAGSTGPIVFPLQLRFDGDLTQAILGENRFTLDNDQINTLLERGLYINVHTKQFTPGEIRGQLLPEAQSYFYASLAGGNQTAPVKSGAIGQLVLEVHRNGNATVSGSYRNLEGELATNVAGGVHIHAGLNGQNGPIVIPISTELSPDLHSGIFSPGQNTFQFSAGLIDTLFAAGHYVNVHSSAFASGELRGQLLPAANVHLNTVLRAMNAVQPISGNSAHGALSAVLSGNALSVTGVFGDLAGDFAANIAGGAHIHTARPGMNGGIAVPLGTRVDGSLKSGVFRSDTSYVLALDQIRALLSGEMYVNIHSTMHTGGELRGQILSNFNAFPNATSEITAPMPNTTVTVNSASQETLMIAWTASTDADSLAYIVQVTPDPAFDIIPIQINTANQREFNTLSLAFIDTLLADLGVPIGFPLTVNARVIASDGSLQSAGQAIAFTFIRELPSGVQTLPEGWSFEVYPTVVEDKLNIQISAPGASPDLKIMLVSSAGVQRELDALRQMTSETYHSVQDLRDAGPGLWIVGLVENGRLIAKQRILLVN